MIDGHGDDLWRYGGKVKSNFSTNIYLSFDHAPLMDMLGGADDAVSSYPEPEPRSVEEALAKLNGCEEADVMVTNGATEAIYMIAMAHAGSKSAIWAPTFREYQDACALHGHKVQFFADLEHLPEDCSMVWLCNPNNPTGQAFDRDALLSLIAAHADKVFVIDQAYADYTQSQVLTANDAIGLGNVVLLGSLTKRFAVPGLRIGYAMGASAVIEGIRRWRMPWSVNGLAIKAALYLLGNIADYLIDAPMLHAEALRMSEFLTSMDIKVSATDCNFMLCELPSRTAAELKDFLIANGGILIRDASNFESLTPRHFRIAVQTPAENDRLVDMIRLWMSS